MPHACCRRRLWREEEGSQLTPGGDEASIGRNFADHAKELNNAVPTEPFFFLKPTSSYVGDGDTVEVPKGVDCHYEGVCLYLAHLRPQLGH